MSAGAGTVWFIICELPNTRCLPLSGNRLPLKICGIPRPASGHSSMRYGSVWHGAPAAPAAQAGACPLLGVWPGFKIGNVFFRGQKFLNRQQAGPGLLSDRSAGLIRDSSTAIQIWQTFFSTRQVWSSLCSPLSPSTTISLLLSADANSPPRRTRLDGLSFGPALRRQVAGRMTPWCHGQRRAETRRRRGAHRAQRDGRRGARSQR